MNLEDYIKDLDPDLQERVRACGSVEEQLALVKEAGATLPDEALAAIASDDGHDLANCSNPKCPKCGQEMRQGFLFTSKDGAFSFADEVPSILHNAKTAAGFVKVTSIEGGHRVHIAACCCESCRLIQFLY